MLIVDEPPQRTFLERPPSDALARLDPVVGNPVILGRMLSKLAFHDDATRHGIPVPSARILPQAGQLGPDDWQGMPFMLKLDETMSGSGVHIIRSAADLNRVCGLITGPVLQQDFVPGRVGATAVVFHHGRPTCWFSYFLERCWPTAVASASAITITYRADIEEILIKLGEMTQFHGICGIDWVSDPATGKTLVLELNPRPTPGLTAGGLAGVSFPRAIAGLLAGGSGAVQRPLEQEQPLFRLFPQNLYWAIDEKRPLEFLRTWANAPWNDPGLVLSQSRRVFTHFLLKGLRESLRNLRKRVSR